MQWPETLKTVCNFSQSFWSSTFVDLFVFCDPHMFACKAIESTYLPLCDRFGNESPTFFFNVKLQRTQNLNEKIKYYSFVFSFWKKKNEIDAPLQFAYCHKAIRNDKITNNKNKKKKINMKRKWQKLK